MSAPEPGGAPGVVRGVVPGVVPGVVRVGVIGAGAMGADHVRTLGTWVAGAGVAQVFDMNPESAAAVARPQGARVAPTAQALIDAPDVDAVVVASPDGTHAELVLAALAAGKPVMCEKPLAGNPKDALRIVEAEVALGRRLVQVGFMRRYDPGFVALRARIAGGELGTVRLVHAVHRNASSSTSTDDAGLITGSMVHEFDTVPWLLADEVAAVRVESPVPEGFRDPQVATFWTKGGVMATVEVFVNAGYGYDVRCEVVGTGGAAELVPGPPVTARVAGVAGREIRDDFISHFADAYRIELGAWIGSVRTGEPTGASAWDGYLAAAAAEAGVTSLSGGTREEVRTEERPALYLPS